MRKGKYYGQILKWLQAGSSSEDARACLAGLQISPLGQGGFGGARMGGGGGVVLCRSASLITK